jgi:hypothetical protein
MAIRGSSDRGPIGRPGDYYGAPRHGQLEVALAAWQFNGRMDLRVYCAPTLLTNAREWIVSGGGRDTRESEVFNTTAPNRVSSGETAETESVEARQASKCPEEFAVERGVNHVRDYRSDR